MHIAGLVQVALLAFQLQQKLILLHDAVLCSCLLGIDE